MLRRIRTALADVPSEDPTETRPVARDSVRSEAASRSETARRFVERVAEYKAVVRVVTEGELAHAIASACAARSVRRLLVPADLPQTWVAENVEGFTVPVPWKCSSCRVPARSPALLGGAHKRCQRNPTVGRPLSKCHRTRPPPRRLP